MKKNLLNSTLIIASVFILFAIYNLSCTRNEPNLLGDAQESPIKKESGTSKAVDIQNTFRSIYNLYKDRVVSISTEQTVNLPNNPFFNDPFLREFFGIPKNKNLPRKEKRIGLGSGFVISRDGYICTNYHVVQGVDKVIVKLDDHSYPAEVVGYDEITDVALIRITSNAILKPVYLGDSNKVNVGDWAIAIGNPFGLDKTFTLGVISATGRSDVDLSGSSLTLIQTDASINPGNSGGPLINIYGQVIGINRMIYSESGGNIGIGFAIPIDIAKSVLDQLKTHKKIKRGYIGVQIVPLTEENAKELGIKSDKGALIGALIENSPAEKGGLKVGDVITAVNDKKIESYADLMNEVGKAEIGKTMKVTVIRNKQKLDLFITVAERPKP